MNKNLYTNTKPTAYFHLPGLFEFYDFYKEFLPIFYENREYFYDSHDIGSIYGAPADCIWGGGRVGFGQDEPEKVLDLMNRYGISARLTFSNSLLETEHLIDRKCNQLCSSFEDTKNGVIVHSDLLLDYIKIKYPDLYLVSSTTKVITNEEEFVAELNRPEFSYVVADFRLNKDWRILDSLNNKQKDKVEFLCNECCYFGCKDRKSCYENVSRRNLGDEVAEYICCSPYANEGYKFSRAMSNPGFISLEDISNIYLPKGFSQFKIEGRSLGNALLLEFLLYYLAKPQYHIHIREKLYLSSNLDLF